MTETLREILAREWNAGTRVTNCISHIGRDFTNRPKDCELCRTDVSNHIEYCHTLNAWLNQVLDDARATLEKDVTV